MLTKPMATLLASLIITATVGVAPAQTQQPVYMTPQDIRTALNMPPPYRPMPVQVPDSFAIGIMDPCFDGLTEWLDANPHEKALTAIAGGSLEFMESSVRCTHGTDAYKIVRALLPNTKIAIYKLYHLGLVPLAYEYFRQQRVHVVSMASGTDDLSPDPMQSTLDYYDSWRQAAEQHEVITFAAASNNGNKVHGFPVEDLDGNGIIDITGLVGFDQSFENLGVYVHPGDSAQVYVFTMRPDNAAGGAVAVSLLDARNAEVARGRTDHRGFAAIDIPASGGQFFVRLHNEGLPTGTPLFVMFSGGTGFEDIVNGVGGVPMAMRTPSPLFVVTGGFEPDGQSLFRRSRSTPLGLDTDFGIVPHILGPDSIKIGEKELLGTSVAAPVLAAVLGPWMAGYDPHSFIGAVRNEERAAGRQPTIYEERYGTIGMPDLDALLRQGPANLLGTPVAENLRVETRGDEVVIRVDISHCCVDGLSVLPSMQFVRATPGGQFAWEWVDNRAGQPHVLRLGWHKSATGSLNGTTFEFRGSRADFGRPGTYSPQLVLFYKAYPGMFSTLLKEAAVSFELP